MQKKICFVMDSSPKFLGGTSIYVLNFLKYLKDSKKNLKIVCVFPGGKNEIKNEKGVKWVEIKTSRYFPLNFVIYSRKVAKFLRKNNFDYINSHAMAGHYLKFYLPKNAFVTNTYHGVAFYFYKIHLKEKNIIKKLGALYYLFLGYFLEKPPTKKTNKIIAVSNHVKNELEILYGKKVPKKLVRSSVNLNLFKIKKKDSVLKKLGLEKRKTYGLYVGRGGAWRKGLDRTINLVKEIIKLNKDFKLIVIGPSETKENLRLIKSLREKVLYIPLAERELLSEYYSIADIFFCFSRYEGGAPILTLSEAMASGTIPICSEDSQQEIIKNRENGLIINSFGQKEAKKILKLIKNRKIKNKIIKKNLKKIKEFSLKKWGKRYLEEIIK